MENMGNNVIIHCRATGFPKPRINWFVNGQITSSDPSSINDKYQIFAVLKTWNLLWFIPFFFLVAVIVDDT